ncbi:Nucleotide-binding protein, PIN domain protein [Ferroglobus placidus DSM 10642]|uniref:Nucleotide-binding protein, PIN domain protein n=1 Tax=Ferroglobus placidus (strain DSM 10642 / AEDII12DO) TaxID=589924 RepID=D3S283_FERPA|nr:PIN domain-containing protein [Ferroglobus placidus]ADC66574.1 Nucleotide-binding protein, PIN domain protein [Ferroglobus placidus DSM 10642]
MKLVVDTNVLFSFFKKDSTTRKIITMVELFELFTLKSRLDELAKYEKIICSKARITPEEFSKSLKELQIFVNVIDDSEVVKFAEEARKLAPHEEDIPLFALALAIKA